MVYTSNMVNRVYIGHTGNLPPHTLLMSAGAQARPASEAWLLAVSNRKSFSCTSQTWMARAARPYQPARPGSHGLDRLPPSPYPTMGSPVCGLTGLHWYNASSLSERHAWFTGSGLTGLRVYTPLHSSRCSHGLRRLPPLPIHGFTNHTVYTSNMVDMACTVHTGNMTPRSC